MSGLKPPPPDPLSPKRGEGEKTRWGHANPLGFRVWRAASKTHTDVLRTLLRAYVPGSATSWATPSATASPVAAALRDLRGLRYWLRLA